MYGTLRKLKDFVYWPGMDSDVATFIQDCVLCRCAKAVTPTRVHLGEHPRPSKPNIDLHFDYFKLSHARDGSNYVLVLRDGFSRLVMLFKSDSANTTNAVDGILQWISIFGIPQRFFSDNGSHFRNKTMEELRRRLGIAHDFSTVYCAWANGLIERCNRLMLICLIFYYSLNYFYLTYFIISFWN